MERDGEDGGGRGSSSAVDAVRHGGGKTATMATATALARARERVWRVSGVQVSVCEEVAGERRPVSMAHVDALPCPGRVWRASWHVLGASGHLPFPALRGSSSTMARLG